jgi:hypothetical protein
MFKFKKILRKLRFWKRRKAEASFETESASAHKSIPSVDSPVDDAVVYRQDEAREEEDSQTQEEERNESVDEPEVGQTECFDDTEQFEELQDESDESLESDESTDLDDDLPPIDFAQVREDVVHESEYFEDGEDSNVRTLMENAFEEVSDDGIYPVANPETGNEGREESEDHSVETEDEYSQEPDHNSVGPPSSFSLDMASESTPELPEAEDGGEGSDEISGATTTTALPPLDVRISPNPVSFYSSLSGLAKPCTSSSSSTTAQPMDVPIWEKRTPSKDFQFGESANPSTSSSATKDYQTSLKPFGTTRVQCSELFDQPGSCMVCDEIKHWRDMAVTHHPRRYPEGICVECTRMYLHTKIVDQGILDILCPLGVCREPVLYAEVRRYGSPEDFALYRPDDFRG